MLKCIFRKRYSILYAVSPQRLAVQASSLIASIIVTLILYGAFPLAFALLRKKTIAKSKYRLLCFLVNLVGLLLFVMVNGRPSSAAPYFLWTYVFSSCGIKLLTQKNALNNGASSSAMQSKKREPEILFCRKCGHKLEKGCNYCAKCGTAVVKEKQK